VASYAFAAAFPSTADVIPGIGLKKKNPGDLGHHSPSIDE